MGFTLDSGNTFVFNSEADDTYPIYFDVEQLSNFFDYEGAKSLAQVFGQDASTLIWQIENFPWSVMQINTFGFWYYVYVNETAHLEGYTGEKYFEFIKSGRPIPTTYRYSDAPESNINPIDRLSLFWPSTNYHSEATGTVYGITGFNDYDTTAATMGDAISSRYYNAKSSREDILGQIESAKDSTNTQVTNADIKALKERIATYNTNISSDSGSTTNDGAYNYELRHYDPIIVTNNGSYPSGLNDFLSLLPAAFTPITDDLNYIAPRVVSTVNNGDGTGWIKGNVSPNASLIITDDQGNVLAENVVANDEGVFEATLKPVVEGTKVHVVEVIDATTNSPEATATIPAGPVAPTISSVENYGENQGGKLSGSARPNTVVRVVNEEGNVLADNVAVDDNGNFTATFKPAIAGAKVKVSEVLANGNVGPSTEATVPADPSAPVITYIVNNGDGTAEIKGTADPNRIIQIIDEDGSELTAKLTTDDQGNFTATLSPVTAGETVRVVEYLVPGSYDYFSPVATGTVPDAPVAPTISEVFHNSNESVIVSGTATPNTTLQITDESGKVLADNVAVDENGEFVATLPDLPDNSKVYVAEKQANGKLGPAAEGVVGPVAQAPVITSVTNNGDNTAEVKGTVAPGAKLVVRADDGTVLLEDVYADENGDYTFTLNPAAAGMSFSVAQDFGSNKYSLSATAEVPALPASSEGESANEAAPAASATGTQAKKAVLPKTSDLPLGFAGISLVVGIAGLATSFVVRKKKEN